VTHCNKIQNLYYLYNQERHSIKSSREIRLAIAKQFQWIIAIRSNERLEHC